MTMALSIQPYLLEMCVPWRRGERSTRHRHRRLAVRAAREPDPVCAGLGEYQPTPARGIEKRPPLDRSGSGDGSRERVAPTAAVGGSKDEKLGRTNEVRGRGSVAENVPRGVPQEAALGV